MQCMYVSGTITNFLLAGSVFLQKVSVSGGLTVLNLTWHCAVVPEKLISIALVSHMSRGDFFYQPVTPSAEIPI